MLIIKVLYLVTPFGTGLTNNLLFLASSSNKGITAAEIIKEAEESASGIVKMLDSSWQDYVSGNSPIYLATVRASLALGTVFVSFWAIPFIKTLVNEQYSTKTIDEITFPLIGVLLLGIKNGIILAAICLSLRTASNNLNTWVLTANYNGTNFKESIAQVHLQQAQEELFESKAGQCLLLPPTKNQDGVDAQTTCVNEVVEEMKKMTQENAKSNEGFSFNINWENFNITKKMTQALNSQIKQELKLIFSAFKEAFVFLVEIAMLLNAYIAPVFLALSLLPGQSKLIYAWLSGWLALGLLKISYTIIIGITTSSIVNNNDTNPLFLPLLEGVLSPILALAVASGGGMALFNGLSSAGGGSLRLLLRGRIPRKN
jgi:hypothetical protein